MNESSTRVDYAIRIDRVIGWLAEHLDASIDLPTLADVACLSRFHFHRIYHAMQHETVAETVRRMRLHRAAVELLAGALPVERIARRAGYASQEAFTRAFKTAYGVPPARYRAAFQSAHLPPAQESSMSSNTPYPVTIRESAPLAVAALAHAGDYQQIGGTFDRLFALASGQGLMTDGTRSLGIYYDDATATPAEQLRADACVTVPAGWTPSSGLQVREIRGGRYAVALHVGPYAELGRVYAWLFGPWLASSGEDAADAPCIEEYLNDPHTLPPTEWQTEVWLPLR